MTNLTSDEIVQIFLASREQMETRVRDVERLFKLFVTQGKMPYEYLGGAPAVLADRLAEVVDHFNREVHRNGEAHRRLYTSTRKVDTARVRERDAMLKRIARLRLELRAVKKQLKELSKITGSSPAGTKGHNTKGTDACQSKSETGDRARRTSDTAPPSTPG